ncbi:MAG: pyridoxal-phosphate dependent enzyme [Pseudomonadota bacterium]
MTSQSTNFRLAHEGHSAQPANRAKASILETIGRTPVVRINNIGPRHVALYAKLEAFNPMGSVKDRMALAVIEAAERSGALRPGKTVIEATSGNTGIGLAMVCAQKGYPLVIVMAESFSLERRKLLRFLGAKVVLTSAAERGTGMYATAQHLAERNGWFFCRQFENEANANIHSTTTAREILDDFGETGLDYWVTGFGTGGTLKGVARVLKSESPKTRIVVVEPENSQILNSDIAQKRNADGSPARSHPNARAHPVQGWSPDFVPKLAGDVQETGYIDRFESVSGAAALQVARDLAVREGVFCGISGGATMAAALSLAETAPAGARILAMLPDTGERYLSTPLFDDIADEMNDEEQSILQSAPVLRRSSSTNAGAAFSPEAAAFVEAAIGDPAEPVVMFGFEWCEFCWSVRKLFDRTGVAFRSIDVDSAEFREADRGGDVLRALFARTGHRTVPQVFIGGDRMGGATEVLQAFNDGALQERLASAGRPMSSNDVGDALSLLPKWVRRPAHKPASHPSGAHR